MEYIVGDYSEFMPAVENTTNSNNNTSNVHFTVDDLLNFSKDDETFTDGFLETNSVDSSTVTPLDSTNSSLYGGVDGNVSCQSFNDSHFSGNDLCVPYDELAELEWLSNFVEESFSTEDLHFIPTTAIAAKPTQVPPPFHPSKVSVPGKARSKRTRVAPCDWSSRLLHLSPSKKRDPVETPGRKCLHCASEKTPQWRTGPLGPKTLCNACGVRYKSGRLVPEYRPASSPTFVSAKHSNSHRKVLELRRQKEARTHHPNPMMMVPVYNGCDEFMIHYHRGSISGQDFRHMI